MKAMHKPVSQPKASIMPGVGILKTRVTETGD